MSILARYIRCWRCTSGATAIEFALVAPIAILLCLSVLELSRAIYTRNELSYAIDIGARRVLLDPMIQDQELRDIIRLGLTASIRSQVSINMQTISDTGSNHRFVEASVPFTFVVPIVPQGSFVLAVRRRIPLM